MTGPTRHLSYGRSFLDGALAAINLSHISWNYVHPDQRTPWVLSSPFRPSTIAVPEYLETLDEALGRIDDSFARLLQKMVERRGRLIVHVHGNPTVRYESFRSLSDKLEAFDVDLRDAELLKLYVGKPGLVRGRRRRYVRTLRSSNGRQTIVNLMCGRPLYYYRYHGTITDDDLIDPLVDEPIPPPTNALDRVEHALIYMRNHSVETIRRTVGDGGCLVLFFDSDPAFRQYTFERFLELMNRTGIAIDGTKAVRIYPSNIT